MKNRKVDGVTQPFLGYETAEQPGAVGFAQKNARAPKRRRSALHTGLSHLLTIGATGSGKTNLLIANLLQYAGSAIVVDIRGDAVRATERFRREELGQSTYVLDPFGVTGRRADRLNLLDIVLLPNVEPDVECQTMAACLASRFQEARDPFWSATASDLIAADLSYLLSADPAKRSFDGLIDMLYSNEPVYDHAVLLDNQVEKGSFAFKGISAWLEMPDTQCNTRYCVLATAHSMVHMFRSAPMRAAMAAPSTINLMDLLEGKPMTVYLVLPIERMASHGVCLRLWLDLLLQVLMRRQVPPELPALVMVDESAQIGPCPALKTVATYLRAHGVRLWSFWQDLSQLRSIYPNDWETLVNNTSALTFMPGTGLAGRELAAIAGVSRSALDQLDINEQLVCETGQAPRVVRMAKYWKDWPLIERYDPIPRFGGAKSR